METLDPQLDHLVGMLRQRLNEAMSSLVHQEVEISINHSSLLSVTDGQALLPWPTAPVTGVYIPLMGDVTGDIFLLLPVPSANFLADLMIGNPPGTTTVVEGFEASAIQEMGNILTGVVVTEISNAFKLSILLTVPNLATGMASALIDQTLISYGASADKLLAITFPFNVPSFRVEGSFILLFDLPSLQKLSKADHGE